MRSMIFAAGFILISYSIPSVDCNSDGRRLYDWLMRDYNKLVRPVLSDKDTLNVSLEIKLTQLIDVDEVNQVVVTNIWLRQQWNDYRLAWNPEEYGGVETIQIPSDTIWTPDIVLYNNADGSYEITIKTKAVIKPNGDILWEPPAIYRSYCYIVVEYFPYDEQTCKLKFGTWSYDADQINLRPLRGYKDDQTKITNGIDLSEYYLSIEWDVVAVSAQRSELVYSCCPNERYIDITYTFTIRRKTMYFTVPCVAISFLTVLVFYLPSDSGEKITLSISVLMSLTVFFLLLAENIPPTSLKVPLIGKYLIFTMILVTLSTMITVGILDIHFRSASTHPKMASWIRRVFIEILPGVLHVKRPREYAPKHIHKTREQKEREKFMRRSQHSPTIWHEDTEEFSLASYTDDSEGEFRLEYQYSSEVNRAIEGLKFIADRFQENKEHENEVQDWKFAARVIDRFFLLIFGLGCTVGTGAVILNAPSLYDQREPIPFKCTNATNFFGVDGQTRALEEAFLCSRLL